MTFLSPWTALLAAAVALPLLILLYFLKLRRQQVRIASTLLWEKSFQDLQVNAPFQRLRWSILLLLQLLLLLLLLLALAEPLWRDSRATTASRVVLLIDRSASMNARDADAQNTSRLDAAKAAARELIENLSRSSRATQAMIVAVGASPQVVSGFESNRRALLEAVDSITGTDEEIHLDAALQLAGAFAARGEEQPQQTPPEVVLISDGNVGRPRESSMFQLRSGTFRFVPVGPPQPPAWETAADSVNNIGVVAFSARREYDDPASINVFARLLNAGPAPIDLVLTLEVDGQPATIVRRTVPAATETAPGEETFQHRLQHAGGAALSIRHNHPDDLSADDQAWLVMPPPSAPRIALVHPDDSEADPYLRNLIAEMDSQRVDVLTRAAYESRDAQDVDSGAVWDWIVFDRVSPSRLPAVPTLCLGAAPGGVRRLEPTGEAQRGGRSIISWDRQHPLMRHVSLDTVLFAGAGALELPDNAVPLAFAADGPVIGLVRGRSARHVVVGFELARSNWPLHVSIAVFLQNVREFLIGGAGATGTSTRPGEPVTVRAAPEAASLRITGPMDLVMPVRAGEPVTLPALRRVGVYRLQGTGGVPPIERVAVSMLSDVESDIRTRGEVHVNADSAAAAASRGAAEAGRELWPWLIAAAFALLVIEWVVYCLRVR